VTPSAVVSVTGAVRPGAQSVVRSGSSGFVDDIGRRHPIFYKRHRFPLIFAQPPQVTIGNYPVFPRNAADRALAGM
jgi:hypothetical protein